MAKGQLEPNPFEDDIPLPVAKAPDFDLSDETVEHDSNNDLDAEVAEEGVGGEPEGVFNLFDREFPPGERNPIDPSESGEFDREFSETFEEMFEAIRGDDSAPLFDESSIPIEKPIAEPEPVPEEDSESQMDLEADGEVTADPQAEESEDQFETDSIVVETDSESLEDSLLPIPKPEQNSGPTRDISDELEELTLEDEFALDEELPTIGYEELDPLDLSPEDTGLSFEVVDSDEDEDYENSSSEAAAASWSTDEPLVDEDALEELNFDDSDEEELYDEDLSGIESAPQDAPSDDFDEFAKLALGFDDDEEDDPDEEALSEEDDFVVEELGNASELDPFEEIAIMSSEDVAKYEPSFGAEELQFKDEEPLPEDADPFGDGGFDSAKSDDEESLEDLDPFGDGGSSKGSSPADEKKEEEDFDPNAVNSKGDKDGEGSGFKLPNFGPVAGILRLPWKIFSTAVDFLFGILETVLKVLGGIPLIGLPFRVISSVLTNIPAALKRVLVLVLIVLIFWGGGSVVSNLLPKPSVSISLPDSGGAKFSNLELKDGKITGEIENTGAILLQVFPRAEVSERKLFEPGTWFKPKKLGNCEGSLVEVPIDGTVKVSYDCKVAVDGKASLKPSLRE